MFFALVSIFNWIFVIIFLIALMPVATLVWLITYPFDKKLKILHLFTSFWGMLFIWINPFLKVKITGKEKINPKVTYVMVSNHQSLLDIIVVYSLFSHFKWVAKKELFNVPILGWTMRMNKYVSVDRGNKGSHLKMMTKCENYLKTGSSIMIFPEGTRSETGEIQNFKDGAFIMAQVTTAPILPIIIDGTASAIPKNHYFFRKLTLIQIKILDPIDVSQHRNLSVKELNRMVRDVMANAFNEMQMKNDR